MHTHLRYGWLLLLASVVTTGCNRTPPAPPPAKPPEVLVSHPLVQEIADYEDFTGRTESVASVEIRARVTGYLDKVAFKDGADVRKGDLLFEIDPRSYQAELERAEAALRQTEVRLKRLTQDYERALSLRSRGALSQEEYDKIAGDRAEADSALGAARAVRDLAQLNLSYTKIHAPLSGRISRRFIDPGNLVKADETVLTTIGDSNPIYITFDVDERTVLRVIRLIEAGKVKSALEVEVPVIAALADEEGFPHKGTINFVDNRIDPNTGTLRMRGVFPNPSGLMAPGLFARVRVPLGDPAPAVVIAEQALGTDQGQRFVYVVNDKDEAVYRRVQVGRLNNGVRAIKEGLEPTDRIVVSGVQRVRPNSRVTPKEVPMPGMEPRTEAQKAKETATGPKS